MHRRRRRGCHPHLLAILCLPGISSVSQISSVSEVYPHLLVILCLPGISSVSQISSVSEVYPHLLVILCLPGISPVGQSSWYLISQPGGCISCLGVCITLCPTICVRCCSEAHVDGGGRCHKLAAMPTRLEKLDSHTLWRVTLPKGSAAKFQKQMPTSGRKLRGGTLVTMETTGETHIVTRWNPPRKYDTVKKGWCRHSSGPNKLTLSLSSKIPTSPSG